MILIKKKCVAGNDGKWMEIRFFIRNRLIRNQYCDGQNVKKLLVLPQINTFELRNFFWFQEKEKEIALLLNNGILF